MCPEDSGIYFFHVQCSNSPQKRLYIVYTCADEVVSSLDPGLLAGVAVLVIVLVFVVVCIVVLLIWLR